MICKKKFRLISTKGQTKNVTNGYSILNCAKYFADDGSQNDLIFQQICYTFRMPTGDTETIIAWQCK